MTVNSQYVYQTQTKLDWLSRRLITREIPVTNSPHVMMLGLLRSTHDKLTLVYLEMRKGGPVVHCSSAGQASHCILLWLFRSSFFFFSPSNLRGRSVDCLQTLPHVQWWPISKFGNKFGNPPQKLWRSKNIKILAWFQTTSVGCRFH